MIKLRELKNARERRESLEKSLKISLKNIGQFSFSEEETKNKNIENLIGAAQIPLGVAGPLQINNLKASSSSFFIPLATTEGALVASVNRGCKAVSESGGVNVFLEKVGTTRGPVFRTRSLKDSFKLKTWLLSHLGDLRDISGQTSAHLKLLKIQPQVLGRNVYVRLYFDTDQAMGMNMATVATQALAGFIAEKTGVRCLAVSGNFCVDKKPAWENFLLGRGRKVWAEVTLKERVLEEVLKTNASTLYQAWLNKSILGSAISGSLGFNAHFGNILAAIFAACGQDLAHVTEGSLGMTTCEIEGKDLYFSVYLPDLMVGTVGGGTSLGTQKEALAIIFGREKAEADDLARIISGAVLAGEISLISCLAEGKLACAHQQLGRGKRA